MIVAHRHRSVDEVCIAEHPHELAGQIRWRRGIGHQPGLTILNQVDIASRCGHDAGQPARHRLQQAVAHSFRNAGQDEQVRGLQIRQRIALCPEEVDMVPQLKRVHQLFEFLSLRSVADQQQLGGRNVWRTRCQA